MDDEPTAQQNAALDRRLQQLVDGLLVMGRQDRDLHHTKGTLLGIAISLIEQGLREGWDRDIATTEAALNRVLAERGSAFRLVRPS
jgi:hypothetical protein